MRNRLAAIRELACNASREGLIVFIKRLLRLQAAINGIIILRPAFGGLLISLVE
jgi:hypothetical protein